MNPIFGKEEQRLFEAILSLRTAEECENFFTDAFTINEIKDIAQRLEVARQLAAGKVYTEIAAATGASTATISRVNKCLHYGAGGYTLALARLAGKEENKD